MLGVPPAPAKNLIEDPLPLGTPVVTLHDSPCVYSGVSESITVAVSENAAISNPSPPERFLDKFSDVSIC